MGEEDAVRVAALRVILMFVMTYVTNVKSVLSRFRFRHPLVTYALINVILKSVGANVVVNNALRVVTLN